MSNETENVFDRAWLRLANDGRCSEVGGDEYLRLKDEYAAAVVAGDPVNAESFIVARAQAPQG